MASAGAARSTAPRRRASHGRGRGAIRWDRLGRAALLGLIGIILLLYISPTKHWIEQSGTKAAQEETLRGLESENAELEQRIRRLENPATLEQEARRLGMVREGERAYVIENAPR